MFKPSLIRSRKAVAIIAGLTLLAGGAGVVVAQSAQEPIIWDKRRLDQLDRNVRRLERALYQRNAAGQPLLVEPDPEVIALRGQVNGMERRLSDLEATLQRVNADLARSTLALDEASSATDGLRERLLDSEGRITKLEGQISALEAARAAEPVSESGSSSEDFAAAMRDLNQGDYEAAHRRLEDFVEVWPDADETPQAWYRLAETRAAGDDLDGAIAAYAFALDGWPRNDWAAEATVKLAAALEADDRATQACQALVEFERRYEQAASNTVRNRAATVYERAECD